ncbi:MAG: APC family permease [Thermoguttaceae bacterium]
MPQEISTSDAAVASAPTRQLTLYDSTCIIVGIIIGVAIFRSSPVIASLLPNAAWLVGVWILGGVLSLIGALCYAELANAYPQCGGDYVYLTRAYGRPLGFLFAWSQLWVVRPGSIGAMAFAFADYANQIWPCAVGPSKPAVLLAYAVGSIVVLTGINILGVREGKWTQNLLTTVKVLGLGVILIVGFCYSGPQSPPAVAAVAAKPETLSLAAFLDKFGLAMIFVLFAYGGWNEMAYVAAEVKNPRKNILRAMILGTVAVAAIYVLVNLSFVHALGFQGARHETVAADVLQLRVGRWAGQAISLLIAISALAAINGQIFTGARIYYAMGTEHRLYSWLGRWNRRLGTPVPSLIIQSSITLALVVGYGMTEEGFESMVKFTTPAFWIFLALVGLAVFVLRYREPQTDRPYRVPLYPITPILFALSSGYMVYASLSYAIRNGSWEAIWALAILAVGVVVAFFDPKPKP